MTAIHHYMANQMIKVKWVASDHDDIVTVRATEQHGTRLIAWLIEFDMYAELDLVKPNDGWLIYPN